MTLMKKTLLNLSLALSLAALVATPALAEDQDSGNKDETTVEHSKNPITGKHTRTETTERSVKKGGKKAEVKSVKKTKTDKQGNVESETIDVEGEAKNKD